MKLLYIIICLSIMYSSGIRNAYAEVKSFESEASVIIKKEDTIKSGMDSAYKEAIRKISEQAIVYIKSYSELIDGILKTDVIEVYSTSVVKVMNKEYKKIILPTGELEVTINMIADVDIDKATQLLQEKINIINKKGEYDKINNLYKDEQKELNNVMSEYDKRSQQKYYELIDEGEKLYISYQYLQAIDKFTKAIEFLDTNSIGYGKRARCYLAIGEYEKARMDLKKSLQYDGENLDALYGLGEYYDYIGEKNKAKESYKKFFNGADVDKYDKEIRIVLSKIS